MSDYAYCGDVIRSGLPLPELMLHGHGVAAAEVWTYEHDERPSLDATAERGQVVHEWRDSDGNRWLTIERFESAYRLRCAYRLRFAIGAEFIVDGGDIRSRATPAIPAHTLRHLLLDQVLPLAMSQRRLVLHGSCVAIDGPAVVFAGCSGQGKSTLAAACVAAGGTMLADDCARLEPREGTWFVHPAYPGVRLWPDAVARFATVPAPAATVAHYTEKVRLPAPPIEPRPCPLGRIYLLEWAESGSAAIAPADARAIIDVHRFTFRLDPNDREKLAADFGLLGQLVKDAIVWRLVVPRSFERVPEVLELVS